MQIILASESERRKKLLSYLLNDFKVVSSQVDEEKYVKLARTPEELVVNLALLKAKNTENKDGLIISADEVVVLSKVDRWQILGKPRDNNEAYKTLKQLRGQTHQVYTGICILNNTSKLATDFSLAEVTFKKFSDQVIREYVSSGRALDKAGAYGIQEIEAELIQKFIGSYSGIIGLPLMQLELLLKQFGIKVKSDWQELFYRDYKHNP